MRHRIHILFALAVLFGLFISCSQLGLNISFKDSLLSLHQDDIEAGSKLYTMKFNHKVGWVDDETKTFTLTIGNSEPISSLSNPDLDDLDAVISSDKLKIYIMFLDQVIQENDNVTISFADGILKRVDGIKITSPQTIEKVAVEDRTGPEVVPFEVVPFMNTIILPPKPKEITKVIVIFKESIVFYSDTITKESIEFYSNTITDTEKIDKYVTLKLDNHPLTIISVSIPERQDTPINNGTSVFGPDGPLNNDKLVFDLDEPLVPGTLSVVIEDNAIKDQYNNPNKQISFEMVVSY